ncbi:Release factor glutamine methyltransferase [Maioricimonas rarisocia]|uniref:Release factor glutamine methyltransferase n=1 Tax=Maioricimonas rarisocia TaxID=2528026 RepID=A0A517ZFV9_9PLAN|nr:peptide chain release factor N(5)-glutamine methyltransferase [Maioricimonas rarisocia]QDU41366.1 Release factor glutamine methyltransferase [Maioricimonas rarisocia]
MSSPRTTSDGAWTVRRVLEWTTGYLREHGSETPRLEAEVLLAFARNCPRIRLYTDYDEELDESVRGRMRELVRRRAAHEPVAYLVGHREFFSLDFEVTPDVLIPRPDTETMIVAALERARDMTAPRIADLGTGSGCIAIAMATQHRGAEVTAVDISEAALAVARRNAERHKVVERVRFLQGDMFAALPEGERFELILSNPPYIPSGEIPTLSREVVDYEPKSALDGGDDGLDFVRQIVSNASGWLTERGHVMVEISPEQAAPASDLFRQDGRYDEVQVINDLSGAARVVAARLA